MLGANGTVQTKGSQLRSIVTRAVQRKGAQHRLATRPSHLGKVLAARKLEALVGNGRALRLRKLKRVIQWLPLTDQSRGVAYVVIVLLPDRRVKDFTQIQKPGNANESDLALG